MSIQTLPVCSDDGHRFNLSLQRAEFDAPDQAPLLLFLPAMGTRARFYNRLGGEMARSGISFAAMDWRGIESSSQRASRRVDWGYEELIAQDVAAAKRCLREVLPNASLWMGGHSLGGQLSAQFAGRAPQEVQGLVLIAAGTVHFRAWPGISGLRLLALTQTAWLLSKVLGHYPGQTLRFAGREARSVIRDWAGTARFGRYRFGPDPDAQEAAMRELKKPVLALSFSGDTLAPEAAMNVLVSKMPACKVTRWHWAADKTHGETLDHFSWAKRPEIIAPAVSHWIDEQQAALSPASA